MANQSPHFGPDDDATPWLTGPRTATGRLVTWAFILGSISHLLLGDAAEPGWLMPNLIYAAGLALLAWRGAAVGWLLCALGAALPLLLLRDILTQSMILLVWSLTAGVSLTVVGFRGRQAPSQTDPSATPGEWVMLHTFRAVTVATYALAGLHKLNRDFLDPAVSCATYGLLEWADYWRLPHELVPAWMQTEAASLVLAAELGIPALLLLGRRHLAWLLAVAFHIPLTLTMAPAFAYVMFAGHAAFATPDDIARLKRATWPTFVACALAAAGATALSKLLHGAVPEPTLLIRHWWLWMLGFCLLALFTPWRRSTLSPPDRQPPAPSATARRVALLPVAFFIANGLTPYLGVQYQHAGAMVSNLRIDRGCWNHLFIPERLRLTDDYIRVDQAFFAEPGRNPEYEQVLERQLWSPPQLRQMRRNWCKPSARPLYLRGTFRQREFVIDDLCTAEPLPFDGAGIFGVEIFGDYLRFQKNLERACPQACIH